MKKRVILYRAETRSTIIEERFLSRRPTLDGIYVAAWTRAARTMIEGCAIEPDGRPHEMIVTLLEVGPWEEKPFMPQPH